MAWAVTKFKVQLDALLGHLGDDRRRQYTVVLARVHRPAFPQLHICHYTTSGKCGAGGTPDDGPERGAEARSAGAPRGVGSPVCGSGAMPPEKFAKNQH